MFQVSHHGTRNTPGGLFQSQVVSVLRSTVTTQEKRVQLSGQGEINFAEGEGQFLLPKTRHQNQFCSKILFLWDDDDDVFYFGQTKPGLGVILPLYLLHGSTFLFFYRSYNLNTRNLCSLEHKFKCRKTPCPPSNLLRKSCLAMGRGGVRGPRARGRVPPAAGGKHSPWTSSLSAESHRAARNFCENLMVFRGLPRACWEFFLLCVQYCSA